jgi:hypothetical protein
VKQAIKETRLSCHRFGSNEVRLALSLLAYNLGNLWRRVAAPKRSSIGRRFVGESSALLLAFVAERHLNQRRFGANAGPNRAAAGTDR